MLTPDGTVLTGPDNQPALYKDGSIVDIRCMSTRIRPWQPSQGCACMGGGGADAVGGRAL